MTFEIVKGFHIIAVIAWMAALLYMPRLFVYHSRAAIGSDMDETFKLMERKLEQGIMIPAMIAVVALGSALVFWFDGVATLSRPWMLLKLAGVAGLLIWHFFLGFERRALAAGERRHTERFWRMTNELPIIAATVIVLSVTTKFGA